MIKKNSPSGLLSFSFIRLQDVQQFRNRGGIGFVTLKAGAQFEEIPFSSVSDLNLKDVPFSVEVNVPTPANGNTRFLTSLVGVPCIFRLEMISATYYLGSDRFPCGMSYANANSGDIGQYAGYSVTVKAAEVSLFREILVIKSEPILPNLFIAERDSSINGDAMVAARNPGIKETRVASLKGAEYPQYQVAYEREILEGIESINEGSTFCFKSKVALPNLDGNQLNYIQYYLPINKPCDKLFITIDRNANVFCNVRTYDTFKSPTVVAVDSNRVTYEFNVGDYLRMIILKCYLDKVDEFRIYTSYFTPSSFVLPVIPDLVEVENYIKLVNGSYTFNNGQVIDSIDTAVPTRCFDSSIDMSPKLETDVINYPSTNQYLFCILCREAMPLFEGGIPFVTYSIPLNVKCVDFEIRFRISDLVSHYYNEQPLFGDDNPENLPFQFSLYDSYGNILINNNKYGYSYSSQSGYSVNYSRSRTIDGTLIVKALARLDIKVMLDKKIGLEITQIKYTSLEM